MTRQKYLFILFVILSLISYSKITQADERRISESQAIERFVESLRNHLPETYQWLRRNPEMPIKYLFNIIWFEPKLYQPEARQTGDRFNIVLPEHDLLVLMRDLDNELRYYQDAYHRTGNPKDAEMAERTLDELAYAELRFAEQLEHMQVLHKDYIPPDHKRSERSKTVRRFTQDPSRMSLAEIERLRDIAYMSYKNALVTEAPGNERLKRLHQEYVYWDRVLQEAKRKAYPEAEKRRRAEPVFEAAPRPGQR